MRRTALATLSLLALAAAPAAAQTRTFKAEPARNGATFTLTSSLNDIVGETRAVEASATFDPAERESAAVEASVDWSTVTTGIEKRDEHMRSPEFIDAERFPTASFRSTALRFASWPPPMRAPTSVIFEGTFTARGVSKPIRGEAEASMLDEATIAVRADFTVNLVDYGIEAPKFLGLFPYDEEVSVSVSLRMRDVAMPP